LLARRRPLAQGFASGPSWADHAVAGLLSLCGVDPYRYGYGASFQSTSQAHAAQVNLKPTRRCTLNLRAGAP
jgi:hypothetical protein